jgi:putative hydrolase of the HAD superfamily
VPITHLVFDLDDTLYPPGNGLWDEIGSRINQYMISHAGVDAAQVNEVRRQYYQKYGTTLRGLMTEVPGVNPDEYLAYVHDVNPGRYLNLNPALDIMLASLPQSKVIFTNSDTAHTQRILACLGVQAHFTQIVDIRAMGFNNKPLPQAYDALLTAIGVPATQCVFIEDSLRNLQPAKALGMTTLLVGPPNLSATGIDYQVANILDVASVIRTLTK